MKTIFTTGQAAKICKMSMNTVKKLFDSGQLRGYRIPGSGDRRIPREHLIRFLKEHGMPLGELENDADAILCVSADAEKFARAFDGARNVFHATDCFSAGMAFELCHARCVIIDFGTLGDEARRLFKSFKALSCHAPSFIIGVGDPHNGDERCDKFVQDPFDPVMLREDVNLVLGIGNAA